MQGYAGMWHVCLACLSSAAKPEAAAAYLQLLIKILLNRKLTFILRF